MTRNEIENQLQNGLIVSCQADAGLPMAHPDILAAVAETVMLAQPAGLRLSLPENIKAIRPVTSRPIIGIYKKDYADSPVFITPTLAEAMAVYESGADVIALDATDRPRPGNVLLKTLVHDILSQVDVPLMADISTLREGLMAMDLGFEYISTTLSGYTKETKNNVDPDAPDFNLLEHLCHAASAPLHIIAEGRIWTPEQAKRAFDCGAFAIVVGSAITRPNLITQRFLKAIKKS
jgi:N-acylglucosamine-6-phosphate 2-epimerase